MAHYMYGGRAQGGPRDGIRISAGGMWDGRIVKPKKPKSNGNLYYHTGAYRWSLTLSTWVWHSDSEVLCAPRAA